MSFWISLLNGGAVSLFGSILSASFCDALKTPRKRCVFYSCMVLLPLLQLGAYTLWDAELLRQIYPLLVHLPLWLLLFVLTGKPLWPLISVLTAYFCCQLRRWFALLVVALFSGGDLLREIVELIITLPLLWLLLRYIAPVLRQLAGSPVKHQIQFGLVPVVYYLFDYFARIYTYLLSSGTPVAVEFMSFVCCVAYLAFLLYNSAETQAHNRLQQIQKTLDLQLTQAVREICALRESQELASRYRHDLRHHLQYLSACIENGQEDTARRYISDICQEIEAQKVQNYCENEAANLILSSFAGRAAQEGIGMSVRGALSASIAISEQDLCVVLSNALENALHACLPLVAAGKECIVDVQFHERDGRLFLQVINPCAGEIRFEKGIPVSTEPGHGIGVQSICAIAARYEGIYSFSMQDGRFILRLSL